MSMQELVFRLVGMGCGTLMVLVALFFAYKDREQGCLPYIALVVGFLLIGSAFPSQEIFG